MEKINRPLAFRRRVLFADVIGAACQRIAGLRRCERLEDGRGLVGGERTVPAEFAGERVVVESCAARKQIGRAHV